MFGQGYDFPPICIVVPMRPYGSFSEFYQFIGRGIRVLTHPSLIGRVGPGEQWLDVIYHAELAWTSTSRRSTARTTWTRSPSTSYRTDGAPATAGASSGKQWP